MIKAEWGTKRSCPKCATRFYDLTNDNPVTCISCGNIWVPESVLKSKQAMPFEQMKSGNVDPDKKDDLPDVDADSDLGLDADVDDDNVSPDNDVDLGDDDDLGVDTGDKASDDV